jgi:hypothetical protein
LKKQDIPILITASLTFIFLVAAVLDQTENDTRNMLIITMVFAGVSILILVVGGAPQAGAGAPAILAAPKLIKSVTWLFLGSGIALIIAIIITLTYQYIPSNQIPEEFNPQGSPFVVTITRDATILVPLRNILTPINADVEANIYHKIPVKIAARKKLTDICIHLQYGLKACRFISRRDI